MITRKCITLFPYDGEFDWWTTIFDFEPWLFSTRVAKVIKFCRENVTSVILMDHKNDLKLFFIKNHKITQHTIILDYGPVSGSILNHMEDISNPRSTRTRKLRLDYSYFHLIERQYIANDHILTIKV